MLKKPNKNRYKRYKNDINDKEIQDIYIKYDISQLFILKALLIQRYAVFPYELRQVLRRSYVLSAAYFLYF
jgi:hypothetical protein